MGFSLDPFVKTSTHVVTLKQGTCIPIRTPHFYIGLIEKINP